MWAICIKQDLKQNTCCLSLISIQLRLSPNLQFIRRGDNVPSITNSITVYDDDDNDATWAICCSFRSQTTNVMLYQTLLRIIISINLNLCWFNLNAACLVCYQEYICVLPACSHGWTFYCYGNQFKYNHYTVFTCCAVGHLSSVSLGFNSRLNLITIK